MNTNLLFSIFWIKERLIEIFSAGVDPENLERRGDKIAARNCSLYLPHSLIQNDNYPAVLQFLKH